MSTACADFSFSGQWRDLALLKQFSSIRALFLPLCDELCGMAYKQDGGTGNGKLEQWVSQLLNVCPLRSPNIRSVGATGQI